MTAFGTTTAPAAGAMPNGGVPSAAPSEAAIASPVPHAPPPPPPPQPGPFQQGLLPLASLAGSGVATRSPAIGGSGSSHGSITGIVPSAGSGSGGLGSLLGAPPDAASIAAATQLPVRIVYPNLLKLAVGEGDLALLRRLLKTKNLPFNVPDPETGWPMLFYAIAWHKNTIVEYLLDFETAPSKDFRDTNALMVAIENKNEVAFTLYLSRFPQIITWANKDGQTALIIATQKGHIGMIQALLDMGVDVHSVDADGSTPLHHAAAYGYIECVDILLEHGASPSLVNKMGWSSIDYAYSNELKQRLEARSS